MAGRECGAGALSAALERAAGLLSFVMQLNVGCGSDGFARLSDDEPDGFTQSWRCSLCDLKRDRQACFHVHRHNTNKRETTSGRGLASTRSGATHAHKGCFALVFVPMPSASAGEWNGVPGEPRFSTGASIGVCAGTGCGMAAKHLRVKLPTASLQRALVLSALAHCTAGTSARSERLARADHISSSQVIAAATISQWERACDRSAMSQGRCRSNASQKVQGSVFSG